MRMTRAVSRASACSPVFVMSLVQPDGDLAFALDSADGDGAGLAAAVTLSRSTSFRQANQGQQAPYV
jgi:hypothetical protein